MEGCSVYTRYTVYVASQTPTRLYELESGSVSTTVIITNTGTKELTNVTIGTPAVQCPNIPVGQLRTCTFTRNVTIPLGANPRPFPLKYTGKSSVLKLLGRNIL